MLQAAYGAVDLLVVGHFGSTAGLSAVSTGSQLLNLVTFVVTQLAMGVTVLIARYIGEKKPQQIGAVLGGAAVVFAIMSVVLFILLVVFARPIAVLMAFTACFIVGLVTYFSLPVSLLPDIAIPQITIQMTGENSSARELENTVVTPVRRQLLQVAGLREIKSETRDGAGVIRLEFDLA